MLKIIFIILTGFLSLLCVVAILIIGWSEPVKNGLIIIILFSVFLYLIKVMAELPVRYGRSEKRKETMEKLAQDFNLHYKVIDDGLKERNANLNLFEKFLGGYVNEGTKEIGTIEGLYQGHKLKIVDAINYGIPRNIGPHGDIVFKEFYTDIIIDNQKIYSHKKWLKIGFLSTKKIKYIVKKFLSNKNQT